MCKLHNERKVIHGWRQPVRPALFVRDTIIVRCTFVLGTPMT